MTRSRTTPSAATHPTRPTVSKPLHLHWRFIGLVALGGVLGTAAREGLSLAIPELGAFPWVIFGINVLGALILGFLTEALARRGSDRGLRRVLRLGVGTGVMGGFTTYSTFAVGAAGLLEADATATAIAYGLATVVAGAVATFAGILIGTLVHRRAEAAS